MTKNHTYQTHGSITVHTEATQVDYVGAIEPLIDRLDSEPGVLLASSFEYPGRYTRWDIGFSNPPVVMTARGLEFKIEALNARGKLLLPAMIGPLGNLEGVTLERAEAGLITGNVEKSEERFPEELRSKQSSVFSVLRAMIELFYSSEDRYLGLFGAFGYDLAFQFESIDFYIPRADSQRDLVLYLPDEIIIVDHRREVATIHQYDFVTDAGDTRGLAREGKQTPYQPAESVPEPGDHDPGEYAESVQRARESFKRGDLFEVVPGQSFFEPCTAPPSEVFRRLRLRNPAPYGALMNLGDGEYLVAASPEMYVCVKDRTVETCPISGTIARGRDAIDDAQQIQTLLNSTKEESELTMCTDVDRNDKSRICEPGSVEVIGRRQIEMYSRLIHTVDHVKGALREGYDALDAFLTHTWAVTVTGAPKLWAMKFIEEHEKSARRWYGGAIGFMNFSGDMNTGLTLRTIQIRDGVFQTSSSCAARHLQL
ncbi:MAG: anthranilate synthase component I [Pseudomonadota bacterium]